MVTIIKIIDTENCVITSIFLKTEPLKLRKALPLKACNGLNDESKIAGYNPVSRNDTTNVRVAIAHVVSEIKVCERFISVNDLNHGRLSPTSIIAKKRANKLIKKDSSIN